MSKQELHPRTAVLNKNQKNHSKALRSAALQWLAKQFPAAFDNSLSIRPLKTGIMNDILEFADKAALDGISKGKLREAVVVFTRRLDYLACLKLKEMRIDLEGNELSAVTQEEADIAAAKIRKRVEKSARNARKLLNKSQVDSSTLNGSIVKTTRSFGQQEQEGSFPIYPIRSSAYPSNNVAQPTRAAPIIVKHKTSKQYDPTAVARLKEKLGLSKREEIKEAVE